ncbi:MAG: PspA/IM30 family protein [Candidatus Bathyarchaeia archaeon]
MLGRIARIIESKISGVLNRLEDPREQLDYAYEKQVQYLREMEMQMTNVIAARKRLEYQKQSLTGQVKKLEEQAKAALKLGREDLARMAIQRKLTLETQAAGLDGQIKQLADEAEKLKAAHSDVQTKLEAFRSEKELLKAQYSSAQAQVKIKESLTGMTKDAANAGAIVEDAREKIQQMQSKASAIDELIATGGLTEALDIEQKDVVTRELEKVKLEQDVEAELARLKGEAGQAPSK